MTTTKKPTPTLTPEMFGEVHVPIPVRAIEGAVAFLVGTDREPTPRAVRALLRQWAEIGMIDLAARVPLALNKRTRAAVDGAELPPTHKPKDDAS